PTRNCRILRTANCPHFHGFSRSLGTSLWVPRARASPAGYGRAMSEFVRTRTWFVILTVVAALFALESFLTGDALIGALFTVAAVVCGVRAILWSRLPRRGE